MRAGYPLSTATRPPSMVPFEHAAIGPPHDAHIAFESGFPRVSRADGRRPSPSSNREFRPLVIQRRQTVVDGPVTAASLPFHVPSVRRVEGGHPPGPVPTLGLVGEILEDDLTRGFFHRLPLTSESGKARVRG